MKQFFWFLIADSLLLGYIGSQSAEAVWHLSGFDLPLVWLARLGTLYYFAHFWVIMPVVGLIETPKPLPDSIAKAVLAPAE
jgi:ubiquinol-cytochrome c reductase cytochrome b subunit